MNPDLLLLLCFAVPLGGAVLLPLLHHHPNLRESITVITAVLLFTLNLQLYAALSAGAQPQAMLAPLLPQAPLLLRVEPLGMLFALVASGLWIATAVYSIGYMRYHKQLRQTRFYSFFMLSIAATMGVAFAGNLVTLFVFYELLTLMTWPLVTHSGTPKAYRAGKTYLAILLSTSIGLQLLAILWTWSLTGEIAFRNGGIIGDALSPALAGLLFVLFVFGIGKAALMPFHRWLPAAMVAPTPVSALLHAVAVVKAGGFAVLKVAVYVIGVDVLAASWASTAMAWAAAVTIILGSLVALRQDNLKARLAYSTISQLGYIVLGAALANAWGILGGGLHIVTHAVGKITLFFCAGAILISAHKTRVSQLQGLGRTMPLTMIGFLIGALSIIGLPPFAGTWSKFLLAVGMIESGQLLLLGVLIVGSLLNIAYLLPIPIRAFLAPKASLQAPDSRAKATEAPESTEAPLLCLIGIGLSASGCVLLFFFLRAPYDLLNAIVGAGA